MNVMTFDRDSDTPDLDPRVRLSKLLQALSPAVAPGSSWPDARPGDILVCYEDGAEKLFPRVPGVTFLPVVAVEKAVEWPPGRGSRSAPIDHHDYVPADAEWIDVGGKKACIRSSNGNRIEKTVFVHAFVDGFRTTFAFSSTAYNLGRSFSTDAYKAQAVVDGERVHVCVAFWQMTSELERNTQSQTWFAPRFKQLAILGQENGPPIELVRMARALRVEFKAEEEKRKAERATLSAVRPTPALGRGTATFTTGVERRSWADPRARRVLAESGFPNRGRSD
jgi:hypothetical protein